MKTVYHAANSRGYADHGWLKSNHTFSFASYYNPERLQFGALRVFNDDRVLGGNGFGAHPHENMEIVSIPLRGALRHEDSTGRREVIHTNDVQIMSAGRGIRHSEMNDSKSEEVHFLQIWVLPKLRDIAPRYEQKTFAPDARRNRFQTVVQPETGADGVWINQDAYFDLGRFDAGQTAQLALRNAAHGLYIFVIEGEATVAGQKLSRRDGLGLWDAAEADFSFTADTEILAIEIPMR